jgi:GNAT superfamily N-acetyltransferase
MEAVRAAAADDLPRLVELAEELVDAVIAQRGGPLLIDPDDGDGPGDGDLGGDPGRRGARLRRWMDADHTLVLAGTLDQVVTGFAVCHLEDRGGHGRCGVLDACYVEPEARGVGLGRALIEASVAWLEERGCRWVDGTALPGDRAAKNFYESAGFKARMLTMHREIG